MRIISPDELGDPSRAPCVVPDVEVDILPEELEAVREVGEQHVGSEERGDAASKAAARSQLERPRGPEGKEARVDGVLEELGEDDAAVPHNGAGDAGRGHGGRGRSTRPCPAEGDPSPSLALGGGGGRTCTCCCCWREIETGWALRWAGLPALSSSC